MDSHHITDRNDMPNGGYVKENGISLCKYGENPLTLSCHQKAELWLKGEELIEGFSPDDLYKLIGSSKEKADKASLNIGQGSTRPLRFQVLDAVLQGAGLYGRVSGREGYQGRQRGVGAGRVEPLHLLLSETLRETWG